MAHLHLQSTITSKGQVTIPKQIRDALALDTGDKIAFVLTGEAVSLIKDPDLLELAGSIEVPLEKRGRDFAEIRSQARSRAAERRRAR